MIKDKLLTIFSAPKPFIDPHISTIQRNAIQSWLQLGQAVEVLLIGEETGVAEFAADHDIQVLPQVERNASGTPLVSSIFSLAQCASYSPYYAYVNADILLMSDLINAIKQISVAMKTAPFSSRIVDKPSINPEPPFLLIGQRWDLDVSYPLEFSSNWQEYLRSEVHIRGELHRPAGSDYFVFPRSSFIEIPDFAIGRAGWDNWMIYRALQLGWPVIDGTSSIMIVHQNHDYAHLPDGKPHYDLEESQENMSMAGGLKYMFMVLDANWQLVDGHARPAPVTTVRLIRAIERRLMPEDGNLRSPRGMLARRFRRLRRRLV